MRPFLSTFILRTLTLEFAVVTCSNSVAQENVALDWPAWRGTDNTGVVSDESMNPPIEFSSEKNIAWKTPLPRSSVTTS